MSGEDASIDELPKSLANFIDDLKLDPKSKADALKAEIKLQLLNRKLVLENNVANSQIELAKIDAANNSRFRSYWRPAFGWVAVIGFSLQYIVAPILDTIFMSTGKSFRSPEFKSEQIMPLLYGMPWIWCISDS